MHWARNLSADLPSTLASGATPSPIAFMSCHSIASGPRCLTEETLRLQAKSTTATSEMIGTPNGI